MSLSSIHRCWKGVSCEDPEETARAGVSSWPQWLQGIKMDVRCSSQYQPLRIFPLFFLSVPRVLEAVT